MPRCLILVAFSMLGLTLGCGAKPDAEHKAKKEVRLAAGTEVPLVLLRQISAGSTREGTLVPFVVASDVRAADGSVAIEKGTIAEGEVSWSRSEGTLSGLMNQPARLAVKLLRTRAADGGSVKLASDLAKPDEAYAFTRENTGIEEARVPAETIDELAASAVAKELEGKLDAFFESGNPADLKLEAESREWMDKLTRQAGMHGLEETLAVRSSELERLSKHVRDGSITKLAGPEMLMAVNALQELARLSSAISGGISRKLKGRTIKAYVGTKVKAVVREEVAVAIDD